MADRPLCKIDGCGKQAHTRGWCNSHYRRWIKYGDPQRPIRAASIKGMVCSIEGCGKPAKGRGYCGAHWWRWKAHGDPQVRDRPANGDAQKFLKEVVLTYDRNDCLIWPYYRSRDGRGQIRMNGKTYGLTRFVCKEVNGPPPFEDWDASHTCGNGHLGCVSPGHLVWKTHADNMDDRYVHGTIVRGEKVKNSRLKPSDVREIRRLGGHLTQRQIAERFSVTQSHVSRILAGCQWSHL